MLAASAMHTRNRSRVINSPFSGMNLSILAFLAAALLLTPRAQAQWPLHPRMKPATELINKQEPPKLTPRVLDQMTPDNTRIVVNITHQRVYLMMGDDVGIDSPISSGKAGHETPTGSFSVTEKDPNHRSTLYGAFCDKNNRIVRAGVSSTIDSAPSGTHFVGAPMLWFCQFNGAIGMHVGILPGYAASHGCVRLPADIAPLIYNRVKVGTSVEVDP
jgi:lipoprotein-anchoring transpeptidase ErfK/SrfK